MRGFDDFISAFGMPLLGSSNCGCQKIYKAVLLRVTTYV